MPAISEEVSEDEKEISEECGDDCSYNNANVVITIKFTIAQQQREQALPKH